LKPNNTENQNIKIENSKEFNNIKNEIQNEIQNSKIFNEENSENSNKFNNDKINENSVETKNIVEQSIFNTNFNFEDVPIPNSSNKLDHAKNQLYNTKKKTKIKDESNTIILSF